MHEVSLVRLLLDQVAAVSAEHGGAQVEEFLIEIGPLSGVEPLLVRSAYEHLTTGSADPRARLVIKEVPLEGVCENCNRTLIVERFRFVCPQCGSSNVRIIRGDECRLASVTIHEPESANESLA
jgi:hydrogenase nickel incorporation protein HypA/HybF